MLNKYDFDLTAEQLERAAHKLVDGNGVINADLAKVPAATLKGNNSTVDATPADLSVEQVRKMLDIGEGSEPNTIDTVKVDGEALTPDKEKAVNVEIAPKIKEHNENKDAHAAGIAGNAATADKLKTARNITVQDADGTNVAAAVSFDGSGNIILKLPATIKAALSGNASTADKLKTARNITVQDADGTNVAAAVSFDGSGNIILKLPATIKAALSGNASTADKLKTARNITVQDADGTNVAAAVSFDGSGNIILKLPATIKAALSGNASTADKLKTARNITVQDADGTNVAAAVSFDGSGNIILKLPATIKAALSGNASTADKLKTARNITVQDADGTNVAAAVSFDGSGNIILKLPATIKAKLTGDVSGNAATADKLKTARKIGNASFDGSAAITLAQMGAQAEIKGGASTITDNNLTAARALVSDALGKVAVSDVTAEELGYMRGVVRPVQTQLDEMALRIDGAVHRYGAMWNKANRKMVARLWDAAGITLDTTHFAHKGSIDAAHNNPFDNIYPWSERKLCNIDIDLYMALSAEDDITACVTHWEGDADFSFDDENGVWVYTPEFYHTVFDTKDGYRVFGVADGPVAGWNFQHANIGGRVWGVTESREIGGTAKNIFLPKAGMPQVNLSGATMHTYANNADMTLDDVYTLGAENALYYVEYANTNSQEALGNGVSALYRQSSDLILEAATNTNKIKVTAANAATAIVGAILDIGISNGGAQIAHRIITAVTVNGTVKEITFNGDPVNVTTENMWSIHGLSNPADMDSALGSASGYLGANGQSNAYYRGRVSHGNLWRYILGAYRQKDTYHVFLAKSYEECDKYNAINANEHTDTGVALSSTNGYIKTLAIVPGIGQFACCTEVGGNSSDPVGEYHYCSNNADTVLRVGGAANYGADDGRSYGYWLIAASHASWNYAALPFFRCSKCAKRNNGAI